MDHARVVSIVAEYSTAHGIELSVDEQSTNIPNMVSLRKPGATKPLVFFIVAANPRNYADTPDATAEEQADKASHDLVLAQIDGALNG